MEKTFDFETPEPVRLVIENEVGFVAVSAAETGISTVLLSPTGTSTLRGVVPRS